MYFWFHRVTCGWEGGRPQATLFQGVPSSQYLLSVFRLWVKTIPWPPWFPVVLNGRESGKKDVAKVPVLRGSLWAVTSVFSRRRQQPVLNANASAERSPAMGIPYNFFPLVPLCMSRPDKATLCTVHRSLHFCCVLRSEDRYSRGRTADAGGIIQPKLFSHERTNLHLSKISVKGLLVYVPEKGRM